MRPASTVSLAAIRGDHEQFELSASRATSAFGAAPPDADHHSALISAARYSLEHLEPAALMAIRGAFQNRRTRSMSGGVKPMWAAS